MVCVACGGTRRNSKGGVCVPCEINTPIKQTTTNPSPVKVRGFVSVKKAPKPKKLKPFSL